MKDNAAFCLSLNWVAVASVLMNDFMPVAAVSLVAPEAIRVADKAAVAFSDKPATLPKAP